MMKKIHLTHEQQNLVEAHLTVVHWAIRENIHVNETIYGFEYDDLYQEGCIWLCRAAASYDPGAASFATYAKKVVRNGLISYCRQMYSRQKHFSRPITGEDGEPACSNPTSTRPDDFACQAGTLETLELLASAKKGYRGVARLGMEALEMKVKGMDISEIASLYNVPSSHVGAWISRASQKLRKNPGFLSGLM